MAFSFSPQMVSNVGAAMRGGKGGGEDDLATLLQRMMGGAQPQAGAAAPAQAAAPGGSLQDIIAQMTAHLGQSSGLTPDAPQTPIMPGQRRGFSFGGGYR